LSLRFGRFVLLASQLVGVPDASQGLQSCRAHCFYLAFFSGNHGVDFGFQRAFKPRTKLGVLRPVNEPLLSLLVVFQHSMQPCVFKVPLVFLAHTDQYQIGLPQKLLELDLQVPLSCHFRSRLRWGFDQAHAVF